MKLHIKIEYLKYIFPLLLIYSSSISRANSEIDKQLIRALYIPLADHYAALVAFERYRDKMIYADFRIEKMKNWDLLRAYFQTGDIDMAYAMSPLAIDMYNQNPHFKWIGLMHRDGSALAINDLLNKDVNLPIQRKDRKPDSAVARVLRSTYQKTKIATQIGMPHLLSTHSVVLYRYLKEHNLKMSLIPNVENAHVLAISLAPPKSPAFIRSKNNRVLPAAFEQSLPWADIVETGGFGKVAWYSKDVMPWPEGHVECIAIATNAAIANKFNAVKEVMYFIRLAGQDIEHARVKGGEELESIVKIVRKHIPAHTRLAIIASLDPVLRVINYQHLDIDKEGLKLIMDLAVEAGILKKGVIIDSFSDTRFDSQSSKNLTNTHSEK
jgi:NitT/TauT family transport system substrate-binding protein